MDIYVDGSYKSGKAGVGVIVLNRDILVERTGKTYLESNSFGAELRSVLFGLQIAGRYDDIKHIMSDNRSIIDSINNNTWSELCLSGYGRMIHRIMMKKNSFDGKLKWISRRYNKLANGMARIMLSEYDWEREIRIGNKLSVRSSQDPMCWVVDDDIVTIHEGVFMCTCDQTKFLSKNKLNCRHIWAVKKKLNIVNDNGEGILSPFAETLKMRI